jgi:hypothetical protein
MFLLDTGYQIFDLINAAPAQLAVIRLYANVLIFYSLIVTQLP